MTNNQETGSLTRTIYKGSRPSWIEWKGQLDNIDLTAEDLFESEEDLLEKWNPETNDRENKS